MRAENPYRGTKSVRRYRNHYSIGRGGSDKLIGFQYSRKVWIPKRITALVPMHLYSAMRVRIARRQYVKEDEFFRK